MADPIFQVILSQRDIIDRIVREHINDNVEATNSFSNTFPLLFEENDGRENLLSFLVPVSKTFTHQVEDKYKEAAEHLFKLFPDVTQANNVEHFFAYLFKVYAILRDDVNVTDETLQNIFRFMTHFRLSKTTVVMVFHTPSGAKMSCGYALNGAPTETTRKVLDYLNSELGKAEQYVNNEASMSIPANTLEERKQDANLHGWINQGVLLMNARLTYGHEIWDEFSRRLIGVVSSACSNLSIILAGLLAKSLTSSVVNKCQHYVVDLYHPTHPNQNESTIKWEINMPFINTNFFLYQHHRELIDWQSISDNALEMDRNRRNTLLKQLFDAALNLVAGENNAEQNLGRVEGQPLFRVVKVTETEGTWKLLKHS